jgi:hypothetical protein
MMSCNQSEKDTGLARGLGWASIAIGAAEIAAPGRVQRLLGLDDRAEQRGILCVLGIRELLHGVGILTERAPTAQLSAGLWSRVAGDALDTALLGLAAAKTKRPALFGAMAAAVLAIGAFDVMAALRLQRRLGE